MKSKSYVRRVEKLIYRKDEYGNEDGDDDDMGDLIVDDDDDGMNMNEYEKDNNYD